MLRKFYAFFITLPNRCYPFASEIEGQRVRWSASYENTLQKAREQLGPGRYGMRLLMYRQVFHFVGALLFLVVATVISRVLFGSEVALYVLLAAAILAITVQEFYVHPRYYEQHLPKSIGDWSAWVVPIGLYMALVFG